MIIQNKIQTKLHDALNPLYFELSNESHMHNVPPGSESHFKVVMVSDKFAGLPLIKRHQLLYGILAEEMKSIHALALHTLTAEEYEKRHGKIPASPLCLGGSKG